MSEYSASCLTRINEFRKHPGALFYAYQDFRPSADPCRSAVPKSPDILEMQLEDRNLIPGIPIFS
jgi:hypothetical protein